MSSSVTNFLSLLASLAVKESTPVFSTFAIKKARDGNCGRSINNHIYNYSIKINLTGSVIVNNQSGYSLSARITGSFPSKNELHKYKLIYKLYLIKTNLS
jgi:hypothetical protein